MTGSVRCSTLWKQVIAVEATRRRHAPLPQVVYRYVPPEQPIARAVTYIGDVLLEFSLRFTGSLTVLCPASEAGEPLEDRLSLRLAGSTLHRIADGLSISAVRADRPTIESTGGHRFTHSRTMTAGLRTRRFSGVCTIEMTGGPDSDEPAITGALDYALDVRALAPTDPPASGDDEWLARHDSSFSSIGAVVLAPVPVAVHRAARLFAG
jgi:hypothetical protein